MLKPVLTPTALVMACVVLLGSTVAMATSLTISAASLATYDRSYSAPATCSLQPVADTHVRNGGADSGTNYGAASTLDVRSDPASASRVLAQFDLTACTPSIPADAIIHAATLRLTLSSTATATRTYDLHRSTGAWDEMTVTWNDQPAVAATATSSAIVSTGTGAPAVVEWNVAVDVQDFASGAAVNYGWRLNDSAEDTTVDLAFQSREAASGQPELVITYVH